MDDAGLRLARGVALSAAVAIGDGVTATVPLLWVVMIAPPLPARTACLSLILAGRATCFPWDALLPDEHRAYCATDMALMMFDNLDDREFSGSLGRFALSSFAVRWRWSPSA